MPTIADLHDVIGSVNERTWFFGQTAMFQREYEERCQTLGDFILEDFDVGVEEVGKLPLQTSLGPKATRCFDDMKSWLTTHDFDFNSHQTA